MTSKQLPHFYIPDCLVHWPWPRRLNKHYLEVKPASTAWMQSFHALSAQAQYAFDRCEFSLLAALAYPDHDTAHLRTTCDLMNNFFYLDEVSDVAPLEEVKAMADITMDALRNPWQPRPVGEWIGGEIIRQFWELAVKTASSESQKHFIDAYTPYTQAVVQQAQDRQDGHIRTVNEYFAIRRKTIGVKPCFVMLELALNLPQEVLEHPVIKEMEMAVIDMISMTNDIMSYNKEQARGDDNHNIITCLMHHLRTDIQGAMDWVEEHYRGVGARFLDLYYHSIPKYHSANIDADVAKYVDGLGNWVRATDQWSFECGRYFGKDGLEILNKRWVTLLPKRTKDINVAPRAIADPIHLV
ncbi:unnamed protein product [Peniophora sp. CBMAI 1063]|nr:unnamed protein product [Peniophora sp. CBMAI 1063]